MSPANPHLGVALAPPGSTEAFLSAARAHVASRRGTFGARFAPILAGLEAQAGDAPGLVLLEWSTGAHPLVDDDTQTPPR